jgi:hypothetical protein
MAEVNGHRRRDSTESSHPNAGTRFVPKIRFDVSCSLHSASSAPAVTLVA